MQDLGIYPIAWCTYLISKISGQLLFPKILSSVTKSKLAEVDETNTIILNYESERIQAVVNASMTYDTESGLRIHGTHGSIALTGHWLCNPKKIELNVGGVVSTIDLSVQGFGYIHEADHVEECLSKGLTESPLIGLEESLLNMKIMDTVRQQHGIVYPGD